MARSQVIDLREEIESWASDLYKKFTQKDAELLMKMRLPFHELKIVIDTNNLFVRTEDAEYKNPLSTTDQSYQRNNVLFKTHYTNTTSSAMQYALSTQRTTKSVLSFELTKGYVFSGNSGLKISLPGNLAELSAGLSHEIRMEESKEKEVEQELTWLIDTTVSVPAHKTVTARLIIKEFEYSSTFTVKTFFSGSITVRLFKDGQKVAVLRTPDLRDVLKESRGFVRMPESRELVLVSEGHCNTTCGVEQFIHIEETEAGK